MVSFILKLPVESHHVCIMNASEMYHKCDIFKERPRAIFLESQDLSWKIKEIYCTVTTCI